MSLWSEWIGNGLSRVALKDTRYFHAYEQHLARFRERNVTMLEIGVWHGGSLQLWKHYLGPSARIVGIDVNPECRELEEAQVSVRIGDQGDRAFLQSVVDELGPIDIVLDDGSHRAHDIATTFEVLYPQLDRNGVYLVEDTGTSYHDRWGGGLGREGTFLETVKARVDELHAEFTPELEATPFSQMTRSMTVYPGLVAFERGHPVDPRVQHNVADKSRAERARAVTIDLTAPAKPRPG